MATTDPLALISDHLRFRPTEGAAADKRIHEAGTAAAHTVTDEELIFFSGGVCNLHTLKPGWEDEWPSPLRTQRVVDVMRMPMALVHVATGMDQGFALTKVSAPVRWALRTAHKVLGERGMFLPKMQVRMPM